MNWKRNLAIIWIGQFLSIVGFSFGLPFAPYYIQTLGISDPAELKMWIAFFAASAPLSFALFSPFWGAVSDRFGRKPVLIRAYFGGAIVLSLMGTVHHAETLIALRILQGVLTGTITASQTLVSVSTPSHRTGFALGTLSAAVFSGAMAGSALGGIVAETYGYRTAFLLSGTVLLVAGLLVTFGIREDFKPQKSSSLLKINFRPGIAQIAVAMPMLALFVAMAFCQSFDTAMLPLLVQEIHGRLDGAAFWSGILNAVGSLAGLIAGLSLGWLSDRIAPAKIGIYSAIGAGLLLIPQGLSHNFLSLFIARFGMTFCIGGLDPVFQIWLAKVTPEKSKGFIFGWATTARSVGWIFAPLASGYFATVFGLRSIYFIGAVFMFMLVPLIIFVVGLLNERENRHA